MRWCPLGKGVHCAPPPPARSCHPATRRLAQGLEPGPDSFGVVQRLELSMEKVRAFCGGYCSLSCMSAPGWASLALFPLPALLFFEFFLLAPAPATCQDMSVQAFLGYVASWSSYAVYRRRHPDRPDPLRFLARQIQVRRLTRRAAAV